jgi:carbohydrate diacid regulator
MRESSMLGLDLAAPRAVIIIEASEYILSESQLGGVNETEAQRRAQIVIGSIVGFFHLRNDTICAYIGNGEIAVLKACNTRNLVTWANREGARSQAGESWANVPALKRAGEELLAHLQSDISASLSVGIGRYHPGVRGIARSYTDACAALTLGRRCYGDDRVYCLDSLGTAAFVGIADEQTKIELAAHLLSPLDHEVELIDTLRVFFAQNCCPSSTARELAIHRNTLTYRLQKVALLTGLDPRCFDEATQIHLALLLRSLGGNCS